MINEWIKKVNDNSRERKLKKSEKAMENWKEHWYKMVSPKIKDEKIIESNSLIAQFMGYSIDDKNEFFSGIHYYTMDTDSGKTYDQLTIENVRSHTEGFVWNYTDLTERRYDNSWDFLMQVIEKINQTFVTYNKDHKFRYRFCINDDWCQVLNKNKEAIFYYQAKGDEKLIDAAYKTVVKYIKWYNEQGNN